MPRPPGRSGLLFTHRRSTFDFAQVDPELAKGRPLSAGPHVAGFAVLCFDPC